MTYQTVEGEVNQEFQLLVWTAYEFENLLGCPEIEDDFDTREKASAAFNKVEKFLCKMVMQYETADPASTGDVLEEQWKE